LSIMTRIVHGGPAQAAQEHTTAWHRTGLTMGLPVRQLAEWRPRIVDVDEVDTRFIINEGLLQIERKHLISLPTLHGLPSAALVLVIPAFSAESGACTACGLP